MRKFKSALSFTLSLLMMVTMVTGVMPVFAAEYTETDLRGNGFDYGFNITTVSEDVSYLNDDFTVYRYARKPATYDAGNAVATFQPTDKADATYNAAFTNGKTGLKIHVNDGNHFGMMTYKTKEYTEFYAEYSVYSYYNGVGIAFGMPLGNAGIIDDGNVANDTAVYVRVRETGATVIGAIDADAAENVNPNVWTTNAMSFGFSNADFVSTDSIKLPTSTTATTTVCVEVKDGFVSVWKKGAETTVLKVKLSDAYVGGYVGLFMSGTSNTNNAMYTGFGIRDVYDYELAITEKSQDVSFLDNDFLVHRYTRKPATYDAGNAVATFKPTDTATGTNKAVFTNGLTGFKVDAGDGASQFGIMTYKTKAYTDFYAEYTLNQDSQGQGLAFGMPLGNAGVINDNNVANDTAVYVRVRGTGTTVMGAIDADAAENVNPNVWATNAMSFGFDKVDFVSTDSIKLTANVTVCVEVKDGFVSVWKKGTEATVLKVKLADTYTGGHIGFFMSNTSGAAFTNFAFRGYDAEIVERDTVYLSATGDDTNAGDSESAAVATLSRAMKLVTDGGTIHVVGEYKLDAFVQTEKAVTFVGDTLDLSGDSTASNNHVRLLAPVTFGDITLKFHKVSYLHAQGHALEMTADVTFDGKTDVFGGTQLNSNTAASTYDTSLKLYGGTYGTVAGSHRCGLLHGDTYVEIGGTAVIANLYGGTAGDYGHLDGVTNIVVNGGTITNIYGGSQNSARVSGVNITVNDGTIESVYGGGNNQNIRHYTYDSTSDVATVNITLNGGTITRRVYGGSYNNTSSMKYVYGTTTIKVNGNVTFGADGVTWEGLSAGSRATANSADEISTLDFVTTANKRAYAQYITTGTNYIDTTDTVLPVDVVYETVYLSATGDDEKDGTTAENAVATLERAYELVKDGGTINVMDTYVLDAFVETEKAVTFVGGTLDLSGQTNASGTTGWVRLYAPVTFGEITVKFKANANLLAQCNKLVVSENTTVEGTINVFGGYQLSGTGASHTGDTHVELYAGTYTTVGGANRLGILIGDTYVKIGGTASITNVYGGSAGDYGNMDGEAYVYVVGGGIGNLYGGHEKSGTINGTHVFVSDGFIQNVYGGNKANNVKYTDYATNGTPATVEVVLSGGTVANRVYGGCASAAHHVFGTVSVTVTEDAILGADGFTWNGMSAGTVGTTNAADETATLYFDSVDTQLAHSAHLVNTDTTDKVVAGDTTEEKGAVTSTAVNNGDGTTTYTFVVENADGYEVQAGSLLAKDANGNLYVPTRVGFRETTDATTYTVTASTFVVLTPEFVAPTAAKPNVGNIGTSINVEKGGIRFISRLAHTIDVNGNTVTIDGQQLKLLDYGMLCGLETVIGTNTLDLALAEGSDYIIRRSVKDAGIFFDYCDDYLDMSVSINNIASVSGGENLVVVTRAYMVVDDGSAEGLVLYADTQASSFRDVYDYYNDSLNVVYLSKNGHDANSGADAENAVRTLERAYEIVKDGGEISVVGEYPLAAFIESDKAVTFVGDTLDLTSQANDAGTSGWVRLYAPVTFDDINLKFTANANLLAQGNKLVIAENTTVQGTPNVFGGYQLTDHTDTHTGDTHVELYAGTYNVVGGANRKGALAGESYVKVGGTAQITKLIGGIGADYGQMKGDVKIYIEGGNITNVFGGNSHQSFVNSVYIEMNGGTVASIYGGAGGLLETNIKHTEYSTNGKLAEIAIVLNGGTVTKSVYGGCYNSGANNYHVYGTTTVTVNDGVTLGGNAWEGMSAGSRATANSADETATLDFGDVATKIKYAGYITTDTTYIDTTDVVIPADYDTVYLSATGDDANAGDTAQAPVATLATAMKLVKNNGTVNVVGTYAPDAFVDSAKAVTITGDTLDLTGQGDWVQLEAPVTFDGIDLKFKSGASILAKGNALYITETCTVDKVINVYGGDKLAGSTYSNRYNTSLKLYAGTYNTIAGGNRIGLLHGDTYVEVGGNAGHNVGAGGHIYGGSGDAGSEDFNANGAGVGGINGTTNVVVNGGNWEGVFGASQYSAKVNAVNVTINGGTIESVFGGSEVNEVKPYDETLAGTTVTVTLNGGTVDRRVYGGCYNDNVSDNRAVVGDVTVIINNGFNFSKNHSYWEGIRAGSRSQSNLDTEDATLAFENTTVKSNFAGKYCEGSNIVDSSIINAMYDIANTTDTVTTLS